MRLLEFNVKPTGYSDDYFGFSLKNNPLYLMPDNTVHHNSGKSVVEQNIIGHVSRHSDKFQLVGIDCKQVEFNLIQGVRGVKGVALDPLSAARVAKDMKKIMDNRYTFIKEQNVNNIYKIPSDIEVDYYEVFGRTVQFDELFEITVDLEESHKQYKKLKEVYSDGRLPRIMTIEDIYEGLHKGEFRNPQLQELKGYNSYIGKKDIRKTKGIFKPKVMLLLVDELNELMEAEGDVPWDVRQALSSIARLGRAAGVHLALACQRANSNTINNDLRNNIYLFVLLGNFDSGTSSALLDHDYSHLAKPKIKGRALMKAMTDIVELQTYYTDPTKDWVYDEDNKHVYSNPDFIKHKAEKGEEVDDTGFVAQYKLDPSEWSADTVGADVPRQRAIEEETEMDWDDIDFGLEDGETTKAGNANAHKQETKAQPTMKVGDPISDAPKEVRNLLNNAPITFRLGTGNAPTNTPPKPPFRLGK